MKSSDSITKPSTTSSTRRNNILCIAVALLLLAVAAVSLGTGKYPLSPSLLFSGDVYRRKVFVTLRLSRVLVGVFGGFVLGTTGYIFQTVFRNSLATPDIIGVTSGAGAGAACGILFFGSALSTTLCSFAGAILAVILTLILSALDNSGKNSTIILAGIAVHALTQTILIALKLIADPEKELASIEYWLMGSLNAIHWNRITLNLSLCLPCIILLFLLFRQIILLSSGEDEAKMLGVNVLGMRLLVLLLSTFAVACIISLTGLIGFVGLIAPHIAKILLKNNKPGTMLLSGLFGALLLCLADIFAKSAAATELPVSLFTSMLGAPFLIYLLLSGRNKA